MVPYSDYGYSTINKIHFKIILAILEAHISHEESGDARSDKYVSQLWLRTMVC